jgi:hypothetical protein
MTDWYAYPTNVTGIGSMFQYVNTSTHNMFGGLILLSILIISFLTMKNYPTSKALAASLFITTIFSIMLSRLSIISSLVVMGLIFATAVITIWVAFEKTYY